MIPTFRSRIALWILRAAIAVPAILLLGFVVFELGECTIGLNRPGSCQAIPTALGDIAFFAGVAGYVLGLYLAPVLIIVAVVMELLGPRR